MANEDLKLFAQKMVNLLDYIKDLSIILVDVEYSDTILELNKEQIFRSKQIDNKLIERTYSKVTENITQGAKYRYAGLTREKKQGENFFLYDTGDFFKTFELKANNQGFKIEANTIKDNTDLLKFGNILGLTEENINLFTNDLLIPEILRYLQYEYFKF